MGVNSLVFFPQGPPGPRPEARARAPGPGPRAKGPGSWAPCQGARAPGSGPKPKICTTKGRHAAHKICTTKGRHAAHKHFVQLRGATCKKTCSIAGCIEDRRRLGAGWWALELQTRAGKSQRCPGGSGQITYGRASRATIKKLQHICKFYWNCW